MRGVRKRHHHRQPFDAGRLTIGVGIYPQDGADAATLVANADAALFRAKPEARGSIRFFETAMDTAAAREARAATGPALARSSSNELALHYQPQADINGEITGFEALARWHHPRRGLVPPDVFIPLAEESGIIVALGEWVLRRPASEAASWPQPLHIAVNLSPVQFQHGDLPSLVHQVLLETGLPPSRLELEITEGVLIGDFTRAVAILRRLKNLGVRIAMDDFGTGYSSLSYLQSFPFDKIKIDQAFVANLCHSQQAATIIRAVIALAARSRRAGDRGRRGDRGTAQVPGRRTLRRHPGLSDRPAEADRGLCRDGRARAAQRRRAGGHGLSDCRFFGKLVLPEWIEHSTSSLPMRCSTTELRQHFANSGKRRVRTRRKLPQRPPVMQGKLYEFYVNLRSPRPGAYIAS